MQKLDAGPVDAARALVVGRARRRCARASSRACRGASPSTAPTACRCTSATRIWRRRWSRARRSKRRAADWRYGAPAGDARAARRARRQAARAQRARLGEPKRTCKSPSAPPPRSPPRRAPSSIPATRSSARRRTGRSSAASSPTPAASSSKRRCRRRSTPIRAPTPPRILEPHITRAHRRALRHHAQQPRRQAALAPPPRVARRAARAATICGCSPTRSTKISRGREPHVSIASLPGMAERTLTVFSLSKSYAIAGHRLGYVAGAAAPMHALRKIANHTVYNVPTLLQRAALALRRRRRRRTPGSTRRARSIAKLRDEASRLLPAPHFVPDGATYLFADLVALRRGGRPVAARRAAARRRRFDRARRAIRPRLRAPRAHLLHRGAARSPARGARSPGGRALGRLELFSGSERPPRQTLTMRFFAAFVFAAATVAAPLVGSRRAAARRTPCATTSRRSVARTSRARSRSPTALPRPAPRAWSRRSRAKRPRTRARRGLGHAARRPRARRPRSARRAGAGRLPHRRRRPQVVLQQSRSHARR